VRPHALPSARASAQPSRAARQRPRRPGPAAPETRFRQGLRDAFYGEREFTVVDPDSHELTFCRSIR